MAGNPSSSRTVAADVNPAGRLPPCAALNSLPKFAPSFNIAPQPFQPAVRLSPESGERELVLMYIGRSSTSLLHIDNFTRVLRLTRWP
jgi:hypothetical protein